MKITIGRRMMNGKAHYVSSLPSKRAGCADFGWTTNINSQYDPAINLTPYWQKRFMAIRHYSKDDLKLIEIFQ